MKSKNIFNESGLIFHKYTSLKMFLFEAGKFGKILKLNLSGHPVIAII